MEKNFTSLSSTEEKLLTYLTFAERIVDGLALFGLGSVVAGSAFSNLKEFGVLSIVDYTRKTLTAAPAAAPAAPTTNSGSNQGGGGQQQQSSSQQASPRNNQQQAQSQNQTATNVVTSNLYGKICGWLIASWVIVRIATFITKRYFELRAITDQAGMEEDNN